MIRTDNIIYDWPPNILEIRQYLNPPSWAVFPYGDKVYIPNGQEPYEDILYHEEVHMEQQKEFANPDMWWSKYLIDKDFRLECEREAYGKQYLWLKERISAKDLKLALEEMAEALSKWYSLNITKSQAETLIRRYE